MPKLKRARHRPAGWQRRRARKLESRRARRQLRIVLRLDRKSRRRRHELGELRIRSLFDGPKALLFDLGGLQTGRGAPVRLRAGCPPVRDAEHQAKHRRRKAARAARKRNRGK